MHLQQQCPHHKAMSDHLWVTGTYTYDKITDWHFIKQHMSTIADGFYDGKIFYFSLLQSILESQQCALKAVGLQLSQRCPQASESRWPLLILREENGLWMWHWWFLGEKKCCNITSNSPPTSHEVELWGRACFIYVDCCSSLRGEFRPTHNCVSQFHQSEKNRTWQTTQSLRPTQTNESWMTHQCTIILICSLLWSLLGCEAAA